MKEIDYNDYKACEATSWFLEKLRWNNIAYDKSIEKIATNKLFQLNQLLTKKIDRDDWRVEDSEKKRQLLAFCNGFNFEHYIDLFNNIEELKALDEEKSYSKYAYPLSTIISGLAAKNNDLFVKVLIYYIDNYPSSLWGNSILADYFASKPNNNDVLFDYLISQESNEAKIWLLEYHYTIPKEYLNDKNIKLLSSLYKTLSTIKSSISGIGELVEKYKVYESKEIISKKILEFLIKNPYLEIKRCESLMYLLDQAGDYSNCQTIYLKNKENDKHFDFDKRMFLNLVRLDSSFFIKYLDLIYADIKTSYKYSSEMLQKIWQLDNYQELILLGIDYFIKNRTGLYSRDVPAMFFSNLGEFEKRASSFIDEVISKYYNNIEYMEAIFNIISYNFPHKRCTSLKHFLVLNQDFTSYQKLHLFPRNMTTSGSWIPIYEKRLKDWENILEVVKSLNMGIKLINHISDIEEDISSCKQRIKNEAKRDFLNQFDL